ncbi:MAG: hypothetical protein P1P86_13035 [Bacteroidales bacterium]|nr:hypothetical protein [Bacteroidales bacterium]
MKVWNTLIFAFFIFCMFLVRPRQDIVFGAVDKSEYIRLFEKGKDFVLCVDDNQTFTGTYTIARDTVFLSYGEHRNQAAGKQAFTQADYREILPTKLLINKEASNIKSTEGDEFSAQIYLDIRQKPNKIAAEKNRFPGNSKANILASGTVKEDPD